MTKQSMCDSYSWVFDFQVDPEKKITTGKKNVYRCAEIVEQSFVFAEAIYDTYELAEYNECIENIFDHRSRPGYPGYYGYYRDHHDLDEQCGEHPKTIAWDYSNEADYALIRLDRPVKDRTPLKYRTTGKIDLDTELVLIGNPLGLPTKITTSGRVLENIHPNSFSANIDSFEGNSESAIFNAETGIVEGILVRGFTPFTYDSKRKCYKISPYDEEGISYNDDLDRRDLLTAVNRISSVSSLFLNAR